MSIYTVQAMNGYEKDDALTLEILETIESNSGVTQRHLANDLGVALGLTNSYLKRCVKKGLIKIKQAPANRYFYYLTPKGIAEKSRLTAQYLSSSFDFYRKAGDSYRTVFTIAEKNKWERILFCGVSELSEIASLRIKEFRMQHIGNYEPNTRLKHFLGKPVWLDLEKDKIDACVITTFINPKEVYTSLVEEIDKERILVPDILGINLK